MLVLSRKKDEKIVVKIPKEKLEGLESNESCDIVLTVVNIDNPNKVRLGIEADRDIVVLRNELESPVKTIPIETLA
jgi:sRNA-binding carbon storage regulator CsrA